MYNNIKRALYRETGRVPPAQRRVHASHEGAADVILYDTLCIKSALAAWKIAYKCQYISLRTRRVARRLRDGVAAQPHRMRRPQSIRVCTC